MPHPRFQFSIRRLFVVVTAIAVVLGIILAVDRYIDRRIAEGQERWKAKWRPQQPVEDSGIGTERRNFDQ
jgi:hypothetical protein